MSQPSSNSGLRTLTVVIAAVIGLFLLVGGIWLTVLGGSIYYVIAGLALLVLHGYYASVRQLHIGCMPH